MSRTLRQYHNGEYEEVGPENPLATALYPRDGEPDPRVWAPGRLYVIEPFEVPGIAAADALDALDVMGTVMKLPVPRQGAIVKAFFHDLDDENIAKELWLFRADPGPLPASDAAFALTDAQNLLVEHVLTFTEQKDGINNRILRASEVPIWYTAPQGYLWMLLQTAGADNIAATAMPRLSFVIERYGDS